ncbi:MAG: AsmA-like C-terminal domain-containing protein [Sedimentisphaerales bacterium]|nr:AsmA-like C-terminal domain-containing protein [Sedimentisphaerales bacterium]
MKIPPITSIFKTLAAQQPLRRSPRIWRRRRIGALLLLGLLVVMILGYRYFTAGERLRELAINALERVTGGKVTIEQAQFSILEQMRLKGVRIYPPGESLNKDEMVFAAQDVILNHEALSLLQQRLVIRRITALGATLNIVYNRQTDKTNLHALIRPGETITDQERPLIVLRDGEVLYHEVDNDQKTRIAKQQVAGSFLPDPVQNEFYRFELHSTNKGLLQQSLLTGRVNLKTGELVAEGKFLLEMVDFANLPDRVAQWWGQFGIDNPQGRVITRNYYDPQTGHELQVMLENGSFTAPLGKSRLMLENVAARMCFTPHSISIEEFNGRFNEGAQFHLTGKYEGYQNNDPFAITLRTEGLTLPENQWFNPAEVSGASDSHRAVIGELMALLPKQTQDAIKEFEPTGAIDLTINLHRKQFNGLLDYHIACEGKNAAGRYKRFPYPLKNVRGTIDFKPDNIIIGPLTARDNQQKIDLHGWWRNSANGASYKMDIQAERLALDENLYQCLSSWQQQLWRKLTPKGEAQVTYQIIQSPQTPSEQFLTAKISGGGFQYQDFPLPLTNVEAILNYDPNELTFNLTDAVMAGGRLTMIGRIQHQQAPSPADLTLHFQGLHLDSTFADILEPTAASFWRKLGLSVVADGEGVFRLPLQGLHVENDQTAPAPDEQMQYDLHFDIADGRLRYENIPYELTCLKGKGHLTNSRLTFTNLHAEHQASRFTLSGRVEADEGYELSLQGDPLFADEDLHQAVAPFRFGIWKEVRLWGPMHTEVQLSARPQEAPVYRALIEPQNGRLRLEANGYEINQLSGRIIAEPNMLRLEPLISEFDGRRLEVRGVLRGDIQKHDLDLGVQAKNWPLNAKLLELLPGTTGRLFSLADPNGVIEDMNLHVSRHHLSNDESMDQWDAQGYLQVAHTNLSRPISIMDINGRINGELHYDGVKQSLTLDGRAQASRMQVRQRNVTNLQGVLTYDPSDKTVVFKDFLADVCDGTVSGQMRAGENLRYELQLEFSDLNLNSFLNAGKASSQRRELPGRFDGWFNIAEGARDGTTGDAKPREGRFVFILRQAMLGKLPLLVQILQVLNLSLPEEGAFHQAEIAGDLLDRTARFDRIQLHGNALDLTGAGSMQLPKQNVELIFMVNPPRYLLDVPIITSFLNAVGPKLMQVRVTGPLDNPTVTSVALPDIDETLQHLSTPPTPPRTPPPPPTR